MMHQQYDDDYGRPGGPAAFDPGPGGPAHGTTPGAGYGLPAGPGWGPQAAHATGPRPACAAEGVTIPKPLAIAGGAILGWTLLMGSLHFPPLMLILLIGGMVYAMRRGMLGGGPGGPGGPGFGGPPWARKGHGPWGYGPWGGQPPAQGQVSGPQHVAAPWAGTTPAEATDPRAAFEAWHKEAHAADPSLGDHRDGEPGTGWPMI